MRSKKKLQRLWRYIQRFDYKQKGFLVYLIILTACIVLFPLVSTVGGDGQSFWLLSASFYKSSFVVFVMLATLLTRNFSAKGRRFLRVLLGFKDNAQLLNAFALFVIVSVYLTIGETVAFASPHSQFISLASIGYFGTFVLLIGGLLYSGWMAMGIAKDVRHDTIVADNTSDFPPYPHDNDDMESLFEQMKDEETNDDDDHDFHEDSYDDALGDGGDGDEKGDENDEIADVSDAHDGEQEETKKSLYKKKRS